MCSRLWEVASPCATVAVGSGLESRSDKRIGTDTAVVTGIKVWEQVAPSMPPKRLLIRAST